MKMQRKQKISAYKNKYKVNVGNVTQTKIQKMQIPFKLNTTRMQHNCMQSQ